MARADEVGVPVRLGDSPPILPFRKPFDLTPWQLALTCLSAGLAATAQNWSGLSDEPFEPDYALSPLLLLRILILFFGAVVVFIHPADRWMPVWLWVAQAHFWRAVPAVFPGWSVDGDRSDAGPMYFPADAAEMTRMKLHGKGLMFEVDPPFWWFMRRTPFASSYRERHVPYRMLLPVEAQGSLQLMSDNERAARWAGFATGLKALQYPVQIIGQVRAESAEWLAERAMPPTHSPFAHLRAALDAWARAKASKLMHRRIVVACSAPTIEALETHVTDVATMLTEAGLTVRELDHDEQKSIFDQVYGKRKFFPHPITYFGIDNTDWVTITIRRLPRNCVVGWLMFIVDRLPVDWAMYIEPDDGAWVVKLMEWFQGMCDLQTADTAHKDAAADCEYVEGKLKRNEDVVQRLTLLLTMPRAIVPTVTNRLRKAGAIFSETRFEHQPGRMATLPFGGVPKVGVTRPYDGESIAGCYPFGSSGLRTKGVLLGTARDANEAVTLDLRDEALTASMAVILGTTGAGKTFLMEMLIERSGLPFVLVDMKLHIDAVKHGDFYPLTKAANGRYTVVVSRDEFLDALAKANGQYDVVAVGQEIPEPHPFAQTYNLAGLKKSEQEEVLDAIAQREWRRAVDSLEDRIFAVDEANLLGQTEAGREFVERIVSQGRSVGLIGIVATQEVTDFLKNDRMAKAVTMSSMQFVLAQEHSNIRKVAETLDLAGDAVNELRKFQVQPGDSVAAKSRSAILRVGSRICSLRIEACPEELKLFTTKPSDRRAARAESREEVLV